MKRILILITALLPVLSVNAQPAKIEKETWVEKPTVYKLDGKYDKESAVVIYDKRSTEFIDQGKDLASYYTLHKIIHIIDDKGIEGFNKIYLGISENADIVDVKARSILPGGKIVELDKSNIKEIKDEEGNFYKIFAMEGLVKGCDVEYYYTFKRPVSFFGRENLQTGLPVLESVFQVIAPIRLKFDVKAYNDDVQVTERLLNNKQVLECRLKDLPGVEREKYANYFANLKRVEYKLSYNNSVNKDERLFTWNHLAKRMYSVYTDYSEKEERIAADMARQNGWDKLPDETAKIKAVEHYIKKNFTYHEDLRGEEANKISTILKNKNAGSEGIVRLYSAIYKSIGVAYQFVLTSDRERALLDKRFENWNNADDPVLFFPAQGKFLAPTRPDYRYPWINPAWCAGNGLFCKSTSLGGLTTAIAEVKYIPLEDINSIKNDIDAKIEFSNGLDSLVMDYKQIFSGYASTVFRSAFTFGNEEQKKAFIKNITKSFQSTDNILFSKVENTSFEDLGNNVPFVLHTKTKSDVLIERAGNKVLLKIGMAIGPQVEMYQEKPRQQQIDINYGHIQARKLQVIVPDGYKINNLDDLKMDITYKDDKGVTMGFVSGYELKGNILNINIEEIYRDTYYPITRFDDFKKVINAASDFNKIVLVLDKKA
ncbi:hypothetical protein DJ568_03240 [Mucilaginibacter hurinus]|uniref:DUF3857 domain-containing protein n=1 Tax=Mucilaginibacter hurinus TaxID=2201324 RepID=A0A367GSV4_9SPHI|nr:DUF3857 domain-containing protein [Mucilaginibacter hurinus]RCH55783.1 hypothetical protein DJ568_03240 [Mucilaginibacter hurinus]